MGLIDKLRVTSEEASARARETVQETQITQDVAQVRQDLARAYAALGRASFALIEQGTLTDERVVAHGEEIRALEDRLAAITAQRTSGAALERSSDSRRE